MAEPWGRTQVRRQGLLHQEGKYSCLKRERREVQGGHWKQSFPQPFPSTRHAQVSSFPPVVPLFVPFKAGFSEALAAQPILSLRQQQMLLRSFPKSGIDKKKTASQENVRPLSSVLTPPFVLQARLCLATTWVVSPLLSQEPPESLPLLSTFPRPQKVAYQGVHTHTSALRRILRKI